MYSPLPPHRARRLRQLGGQGSALPPGLPELAKKAYPQVCIFCRGMPGEWNEATGPTAILNVLPNLFSLFVAEAVLSSVIPLTIPHQQQVPPPALYDDCARDSDTLVSSRGFLKMLLDLMQFYGAADTDGKGLNFWIDPRAVRSHARLVSESEWQSAFKQRSSQRLCVIGFDLTTSKFWVIAMISSNTKMLISVKSGKGITMLIVSVKAATLTIINAVGDGNGHGDSNRNSKGICVILIVMLMKMDDDDEEW